MNIFLSLCALYLYWHCKNKFIYWKQVGAQIYLACKHMAEIQYDSKIDHALFRFGLRICRLHLRVVESDNPISKGLLVYCICVYHFFLLCKPVYISDTPFDSRSNQIFVHHFDSCVNQSYVSLFDSCMDHPYVCNLTHL